MLYLITIMINTIIIIIINIIIITITRIIIIIINDNIRCKDYDDDEAKDFSQPNGDALKHSQPLTNKKLQNGWATTSGQQPTVL